MAESTQKAEKKPDNAPVRRVCKVLDIMRGHAIDGLALSEIAKSLKDNASTVHRTLAAMIDEGVVTQLPSGRYALSLKLIQIAASTEHEINTRSLRIAELKQHIAAGAQY